MADTDRTAGRYAVWRDLGLSLAIAVLAALLASGLDLFESWFALSRRWERLQVDELLLALLVFAVSLAVLLVRRHAALGRALLRNRMLSRQMLQAQEQERRRLARDLHDELGQHLNAMQLGVRQIERDPAAAAPLLTELQRSLLDVQQVVGGMIRRLRPAALDELGLIPALESLIESWRTLHPVPAVRLLTYGDLGGLGEELNLAVYRIVQEALTNCLRHAAATVVEVVLQRQPGPGGTLLTLDISDNGIGLREGSPPSESFGIIGMRERVQLLGGRFEMHSGSGRGTTVRAEFLLPEVP